MALECTVYEVATGRITKRLSVPNEETRDANVGPGEGWIPGSFSDRDYFVEGGVAVAKGESPISVQASRVVNVPAGALVEIEGESYTVDDGVIELDAEIGGPYAVTIRHPKFRDKTVLVG